MDKFDGKKQNNYLMDEIGQWDVPKGKRINLFVIYAYIEKHFFWVRLFNNWYGISGEKINKKKFRLFSERNRKYVRVSGWQFHILKPFPLKHR